MRKTAISIRAVLQIFYCCILLVSCASDEQQNDTIAETEEIAPQIKLKNSNTSLLIGATVSTLFENNKYISIHQEEFNAGQALWYAGFGRWPKKNIFDFKDFNSAVN